MATFLDKKKGYKSERSAMIGSIQLLAGAAMISFSAVFVKLAKVGPTVSAFYRMFFGGILLLAIALMLRKKIWAGWMAFGLMMACSLFFTVDLTVWHRSVHYIGPGLATILANFQVFFLAGFGIIIYKERVTLGYLFSVVLGLLGLFLIVGPDWSALKGDYKLGVLLGLLAALAYSFYLLVLRKLKSGWSTFSSLSAITIISLATAGLLAIQIRIENGSFSVPDSETWVYLISYGIVGQVLGWVLISKGIAKVDASKVGLILLLQPSLSFVWDILLFSRPTGMIEILGALMAITAIYMGSLKSAGGD